MRPLSSLVMLEVSLYLLRITCPWLPLGLAGTVSSTLAGEAAGKVWNLLAQLL